MGSCEHGKRQGIPWSVDLLLASQNDVCSMQSVTYQVQKLLFPAYILALANV
jgi:hypothetical protein